jgi:2-isopropylmalate synthase
MERKLTIFDSTLRDGAQGEGISFSVEDKLKILAVMDRMEIPYVEAGNPGSNPKDLEFFRRVAGLKLKHSRLAAFGSTRRRDIAVEDDANVQSMLVADTPVVVIFGKSWDFHVTDIIKTTLEENLKMIADTLGFFHKKGKEVIFDAEHFFDGYKNNPDYAIKALRAAAGAGASTLVLCDTNGGCLPLEIFEITRTVVESVPGVAIGIHCHNDSGVAVANSVMAVEAGATHIQGTFIGFGERCGNANLSSIIPTLQLKRKFRCLSDKALTLLTSAAIEVAEIANVIIPNGAPYVGRSAFAHKGGMHIDAVNKNPLSFEHVVPDSVGNERRILMSEVSGRSTILGRIQQVAPGLNKDSDETRRIIDRLKELEMEGYQFEGAESSFNLVIRKTLGQHKPFFTLDHFRVMAEQPGIEGRDSCSAIIKIFVEGREEITAAQGDGPVNALDTALRKALDVFYPQLREIRLTDYKVRVLESGEATASRVRVLIESTDGAMQWTTVGVSTDIIQASWLALVDSIEYKLFYDLERKDQGAEHDQ